MPIPESCFAVINPTVKLLLRSPLRGILSGSVLVIRFTGRKSGRTLSTPVRYLREGSQLYCLTGHEGRWWHNFRQPAPVQLLLDGRWQPATAQAVWQGEPAVRAALCAMFAKYPQDAAYYGVRLDNLRRPQADGLAAAVQSSVLVEFRLDAGPG